MCVITVQRLELSDAMHGIPMQTGEPNGVRSSDWLNIIDYISLLDLFLLPLKHLWKIHKNINKKQND